MAMTRVREYADWQRVWLLGSVLWLFAQCWGVCAQGNPPVVQTALLAGLQPCGPGQSERQAARAIDIGFETVPSVGGGQRVCRPREHHRDGWM